MLSFKKASIKVPIGLVFFAFLNPSRPNNDQKLSFSRAITYVIMQRKQFGSGDNADGETDAINASVDGP
jgi:hypothetical protein